MRSAIAIAALGAVAISGVLFLTRPDPGPALGFDDSVPDDLRAVATQAWNEFLAAHPARQRCIPPLRVSAAWEFADRAEYRPDSETVAIRVPGTAPNLRNTLIHEFAHHVEFTCPEHEELRAAFLEAQGLPATAPWFDGATWESTPSEQYAEATAEMILGRRAHHGGVFITDEAAAVVRRWGSGS